VEPPKLLLVNLVYVSHGSSRQAYPVRDCVPRGGVRSAYGFPTEAIYAASADDAGRGCA
jgi:hypothetical protein